MSEVVLFHHAQGLTPGVEAFGEELRDAGHTVHVPDLYEGRTFTTIPDGVEYAQHVGFPQIIERARVAVEGLRPGVVFGGFSLGVMPAQMLAQTRSGTRGAFLLHGCVEPAELGCEWPESLPLQVHMMDGDEWLLPPNPDLEAARTLARTAANAELFLYPGNRHLFTDSSLPEHEPEADELLMGRVLWFLDSLEE